MQNFGVQLKERFGDNFVMFRSVHKLTNMQDKEDYERLSVILICSELFYTEWQTYLAFNLVPSVKIYYKEDTKRLSDTFMMF